MTREERGERLRELLATEAASGAKRLHWLSFANPGAPQGAKFLGVCVVIATGFVSAVEKTWTLGINPGGEVVGVEATPGQTTLILAHMPDALNRLYRTRREVKALDARMDAVLRPS